MENKERMIWMGASGIILAVSFFVGLQYQNKLSLLEQKNTSISNDNTKIQQQSENKGESFRSQVQLLEKALAPVTPEEAVEKWAIGIKTRNGALQFAMFSPDVKEKERSAFELGGWTTGVSSPWVVDYVISSKIMKSQDTFEFTVKFLLSTSDGKSTETSHVLVQRNKENWYISEIRRENGQIIIP